MSESNYKEYTFDEFIRDVSEKVDKVNAKQLISALPVFIQDTENYKKNFTVTVYRDETQYLKFTMFFENGTIKGDTLSQVTFKNLVGDYLVADIIDHSILDNIPKEKLVEVIQHQKEQNEDLQQQNQTPNIENSNQIDMMGGMAGLFAGMMGRGMMPSMSEENTDIIDADPNDIKPSNSEENV